ncbi:uncharacterized protein LOC118179634 [Stegodyphus dumicola]|uniref:uncharacterized protein LOC118179634 n=1 Tax=Stegodyphus dumicola TaxID=202533 RepID=UPI0015AB4B91|nr:uncharacterized protein LOC118179634 [Stegodyphus dumicola]
MAKEWINFVSTLSELSNLKIPRFVFQKNHIVLHGFADASSSAYGAAIYVQALPVSGLPTVRLLCSKSRVAPIKTLSRLPGCLLLSRLMDKVISSLNVKVEKVILWSDSTISLAWIRKSPRLLKTFVSNRVALIQELTESYQWKYVPSECNPADVISRGLHANDILTCDIWWNGPDLLREDVHYPEQPLAPTTDNDYVKELKCLSDSNFAILENNSSLASLLNRTNNYMKLIKIFRFFRIIRNKERVSGTISLEERKGAELTLTKEVQKDEFYSDIESLKRDSQVPRRSKLKSLNPFIMMESYASVADWRSLR